MDTLSIDKLIKRQDSKGRAKAARKVRRKNKKRASQRKRTGCRKKKGIG